MRLVATIVLLCFVTACAGLNPSTVGMKGGDCAGGECYSVDVCRDVRARYQTWGGISVGSAAVAGGGALTTALPDNQNARLALGITSAVIAVLSAVSVYVRDEATKEYKEHCTKTAAE
jgi:hypothetical protein